MTWNVDIFTLYPDMFPGPLAYSLSGEALLKNLWHLKIHPLRPYGLGRHKAVDDRPFGGGAGMVLRVDVMAKAFDEHVEPSDPRPKILLSPRGEPLTQKMVRAFSQGPGLIMLCGRFEGVDERLKLTRDLCEISVGDYVLSGGELASFLMIDACVRLLDGVMGSSSSGDQESFEQELLEYPHYTRPRSFEGHHVPSVLLSGNHQKIAQWRQEQAQSVTLKRRPDLFSKFSKGKPT